MGSKEENQLFYINKNLLVNNRWWQSIDRESSNPLGNLKKKIKKKQKIFNKLLIKNLLTLMQNWWRKPISIRRWIWKYPNYVTNKASKLKQKVGEN